MYGVAGLPHGQIGGMHQVVGGGSGVYNSYLSKFNLVQDDISPFVIDLEMNLDNNGDLLLSANIEVTEEINTTNNKVVFAITRNINDSYFCSVVGYDTVDFTLLEIGETGLFEQILPLNSDWNLGDIKAVAMVQTMSGNKQILQAEESTFSGTVSLFNADITSGPAVLDVNFNNQSLPFNEIETYEWDFDNDGTIDSYEENPSYSYTTPGSYDVKLHVVSENGEEDTKIMNDYITVLSPNEIITGNIQGTWKPEFNPYILEGEVMIAQDQYLDILPGTKLIFKEGSSLLVRGLLNSGASNAEKVLFTSETNWDGITITNSAEENQIINSEINNSISSGIVINGSTLNLTTTTISNCSNTSKSAGLDVTESNLELNDCWFQNNHSENIAGAIQTVNSSVDIRNSWFVNNTGSVASTFMIKTNSEINFINNTVANNLCTTESNGADFFLFGSNLNIMNSIIWSEDDFVNHISGDLNVTYSNISSSFEGEGNISQDPLFLNPTENAGYEFDADGHEWTLEENSPCIDAGNPASDYNDLEDPDNSGYPLFPALGSLTNDIGATGGCGESSWVSEDDNSIPEINSLNLSSYPNPYSSSNNREDEIKISFTMQKASDVEVKIINIKGQTVRTIKKGNKKSGKNTIVWNGKDSSGNTVSTGVYMYKVITKDQEDVNKLLIIK